MTRVPPVEAPSSQSISQSLPSKWKRLFFAIVIIVGVGSLMAATLGLAGLGGQQGWWPTSVLSHLSQTHSIIMMAAGSGVGILLVIVGISGLIKNCQKGESVVLDRHAEHPTTSHVDNSGHSVNKTRPDWKQCLFTSSPRYA